MFLLGTRFRRLINVLVPAPCVPSGVAQVRPRLPLGQWVDTADGGCSFARVVPGPKDAIPVVLLHGWTWTADLNFSSLYDQLAAQHPVVAPDVLGHGRSSRPSGRWTVETATDEIIAILDRLGIEKVLLCGFSMGGFMAVDAARRYPDRIAGIVVQASAACYTSSLRDRATWNAITLLRPLARTSPFAGVTARAYRHSLAASPALQRHWAWVREELSRGSLADVLKVADEVKRRDARHDLAGPLECPSEVVVLSRDQLCHPHLQRELAQLIGATVTEISTDHDLPLVDPERYRRVSLAAINRIATRVQSHHTHPPQSAPRETVTG